MVADSQTFAKISTTEYSGFVLLQIVSCFLCFIGIGSAEGQKER